MRVRRMDVDDDMTFGQGSANFLVNSPQEVGQRILTRLRLLQGEWFLDVTAGTPYGTQILGKNTQGLYDQAIKTVILQTPGVMAITQYSSSLVARGLAVEALVQTQFGPVSVTTPLGPP
jgi:hypothetical protein